MNDSDVQEVGFVKSGLFPDTGPSCYVQRIRAQSPKSRSLRITPMSAIIRNGLSRYRKSLPPVAETGSGWTRHATEPERWVKLVLLRAENVRLRF